jgi:hypothetical protein
MGSVRALLLLPYYPIITPSLPLFGPLLRPYYTLIKPWYHHHYHLITPLLYPYMIGNLSILMLINRETEIGNNSRALWGLYYYPLISPLLLPYSPFLPPYYTLFTLIVLVLHPYYPFNLPLLCPYLIGNLSILMLINREI